MGESLPPLIARRDELARLPWASEARMATGKTVLVIDDDPDFRTSIQALLEGEGYDVDVADSGKSGLEMLHRHRPDLVVLDVMMESMMEGYAVNQAIKHPTDSEGDPTIPIVMVSSIAESPDERFERAEELELIRPDLYMTKPLDVNRFLEVVEKATRHRSAAV